MDISGSHPLVTVHKRTPALAGPFTVLQNAWRSRFLLKSFVSRDLQVRYRNSALGYLWSLVEPLMLTGVYYVLFTVIAHRPQPEYPLWVLIGVLCWQLFAKTLTQTVTCLTGNAGLIKQVYFPRELFPLATAGSNLVSTSLSLLVAIPFVLYFGLHPNLYTLLVPAGLLLILLLGLGVGMAVASANAVQRDIEHLFSSSIRAGMFLSPVLWTLEQLPASRGAVIDALLFNPLVVPISMIRSGIQGLPLSDVLGAGWIAYSVGVCVSAFVVGTMLFKRFESDAVKHL